MESHKRNISDSKGCTKGEIAYLELIDLAKRELGLHDEDSPWHRPTSVPHQGLRPGTCSISVFEFRSSEKAETHTFSTVHQLERYFSSSAASATNSSAPLRRLILMEGRDQRTMEVLGRNLGIPPSIFLLHCLDTDKLKGNRLPTDKKDPASANYLRAAEFIVDQTSSAVGWWKYVRLCVPRKNTGFSIDEIPDVGHMYRERHFVSFWSKEESEEGSWTGVILSDTGDGIPPPAHEKGLTSRLLNVDEISKHGGNSTVLAREPLDTLYLILRNSYERHPHRATADPGSAMRYCIPAVLSMFHTALRRSRYHIGRRSRNYLKRLTEFKGDAWQAEEAVEIAKLQMAVVRDINMYSDCLTRLNILCGNPYVSEDDVQYWRWLREQFQDQSEQVQLLLDFYGIRASVEESKFSNRQAKHVGQLTALATFLVPFSVVAGIFSMSGSFAAGESMFWIFWVVAVPLSCVILFIRVFPIKDWLSERKSSASWRNFEIQRLSRRGSKQTGYVEA